MLPFTLAALGQCLQVQVTDEESSVARTVQAPPKSSLCDLQCKYKILSSCIDIDTQVYTRVGLHICIILTSGC